MTTRSIARQGFTLVELLISLVVTAIVGASLVKMMLSQARFMDQQEAWRNARSVSRSGINRLLSDLRIVEATGGLEAAAAGGQDFTVRVPYAFGIMCWTNGATTTLSILPVDSAVFAAPGFSGFAYRSAAGAYTYVQAGVALTDPGTAANCTGAVPVNIHPATGGALPSINGSPAGKVVNIGGAVPVATPVGSIFFLYRRVRYEFKNSTALPGRTGLFRTMLTGGATEEIATPFANTARVNFYVLNTTPAQAAVPGVLGNVRGLELKLDGMSERTPGGSAAPKTANMTTSVFFENRPD
ncbi:MAG TPA: prepilin-type N-terminal cleavage/methylation domain-containing protein [Gemmatimonadales bacterium]|nr:prepilin-type N-terminal cleavage/methylation domain-containing protein [Gemmatimonadales bacterium]